MNKGKIKIVKACLEVIKTYQWKLGLQKKALEAERAELIIAKRALLRLKIEEPAPAPNLETP